MVHSPCTELHWELGQIAAWPADDAQGLRESTTAPGGRTGPGLRLLLRSPSGDAWESGGICCGTTVSGTIRASVSCDRHAGPSPARRASRLRAVRPSGVSAGARGRWIRSVNLAFRCGVMTRPALDTTESLASLSKARLRAWLSDGGGHGGAGWAAGPGGPGSGSYDSGLRHHDGQQGQG